MKLITISILPVVALMSIAGCSTLDPFKERRDGNVVQIHAIKHVKSGRLISDTNAVSATNASSVARQLGGSTGASVAAGATMIAIQGILNASADDDEYNVAVTRPDDTVTNIGRPDTLRINPLGPVKLSSLTAYHVGDWVKVKKVGSEWTLIPCKLPESGCEDKVAAKSGSEQAK